MLVREAWVEGWRATDVSEEGLCGGWEGDGC